MDQEAAVVLLYTWKRLPIIRHCLETQLRNPGYPLRVWALDNGNDDGTREYLLDLLYQKRIEKLIMENFNTGVYYPLNSFRALLKVESKDPYIPMPKWTFITNDDMIGEDGWAKACVDTFENLSNYPSPIGVVSPFHCRKLDGQYADGMNPETIFCGYPISDHVSGNTMWMKTETFLSMPNYGTAHSYDYGDWDMIKEFSKRGYKTARTKTELMHHHEDTQGAGQYNYLRHW
jgi:hypothetical protein